MTLNRLLMTGCVALLAPFALLSGCSNEELLDDGELFDVEETGKADSFNSSTNPIELIKLVNGTPTLKADELAPSGDIGKTISVPTDNKPFSSDYWPMIKNGILNRWMGSTIPSPAEKYGTLFLDAGQQKTMYDWIQKNHGKDVPGVQSWFGICQGWTGSAIMEKTPQKPITVRKTVRDGRTYLQKCTTPASDCVSFSPGDLTGLMAEAYAAADATFIGYRCDTAKVNFKYDKSGRIVQPNCRSNAGTLFLTATNFIKKAGKSFAVNAVNNDEVWNQPAYQYAITQYKTLTKREAKIRQKTGSPDLNTLFILNMPPRAMSKMTQGMVDSAMVDAIVNIANGHTFRGLGGVIAGFFRNQSANKRTAKELNHD